MRVKRTGNEYPHIHAQLVSKELFDHRQAVRLGWHKKPFKYGGKGEYVFRGLITCATTACGFLRYQILPEVETVRRTP